MTRKLSRYGWRKDSLDPRDRIYAAAPGTMTPSECDLQTTGFLPPIWDQQQAGSCTAHGTSRGIWYAEASQGKKPVMPCRLKLYWDTRALEGTTDQDAGGEVRDAIKSAAAGVCDESLWPYDDSKVTVRPPDVCFADSTQKALSYTRVMGATPASLLYHLQHCIGVTGKPVVFGFLVYDSFESDAVAKTGIVPMPSAGELQSGPIGGHCVAATGYSDQTKMFTIDNSWGPDWGAKGRFFLPYDFVLDQSQCSDMWAITLES